MKFKNTLERIHSRINDTKECKSELEDRIVKITAMKQNKEENGKQ